MATNADTPHRTGARDALLLAVVTAIMAGIVLALANFTRSAIENNTNAELMAQIEALLWLVRELRRLLPDVFLGSHGRWAVQQVEEMIRRVRTRASARRAGPDGLAVEKANPK